MIKINLTDIDANLFAEIAGEEGVDYEAFEAAYAGATVSGQCYHIVFAKDYNCGGIVFVGSGSSGATEWTDANSPEDVLARFIADEMVR